MNHIPHQQDGMKLKKAYREFDKPFLNIFCFYKYMLLTLTN